MTTTPALRPVPDEASVVEVYGSKFLLEWLDRDVLASAAALHLRSVGAHSASTGNGATRSDAA